MKKDRCMFFFDFDDTLYSHRTKSVTERTRAALKELDRQGHILVIASGRGREATGMFYRELDYIPETMVLMNGQIICHKGQVVYENHITLTDVNMLFNTARRHGFACGGYYAGGVIANAATARVRKVWTDFGQDMPDICEHFEAYHPIYQAHLYITREEQRLFAGKMDHYLANWSHEYLVNLIHHTAGKSRAVGWCMEHYSILPQHTYAFGDGFNDVDLIEAVAHGIAMGNGFEGLKEKAEYITKASHEDGITYALMHYGFLS